MPTCRAGCARCWHATDTMRCIRLTCLQRMRPGTGPSTRSLSWRGFKESCTGKGVPSCDRKRISPRQFFWVARRSEASSRSLCRKKPHARQIELRTWALPGNKRLLLDDARSFFHRNPLIGLHAKHLLGLPGRPANLDLIDTARPAQAEVKSQIVLRDVTPAAADFIRLAEPARPQCDLRSDRAAVGLRSHQLDEN